MKRKPYAVAIAGGRCNIDRPRTPYAAAKEAQQRGVLSPVRMLGRSYLPRTVNGEGLPLLLQQRSWR